MSNTNSLGVPLRARLAAPAAKQGGHANQALLQSTTAMVAVAGADGANLQDRRSRSRAPGVAGDKHLDRKIFEMAHPADRARVAELFKLSRSMVRLTDLEEMVRVVLAAVGQVTRSRRAYLRKLTSTGGVLHTYCWSRAPKVGPGQGPNATRAQMAWLLGRLRRAQTASLRLTPAGRTLLLAVPVRFGGDLLGFLAAETQRVGAVRVREDLRWLALVGEVLGQALMREQASRSLRRSEELSRATLNALPAHIAVLDQQGRILAVNDSWLEFARQNNSPDPVALAVGADYLQVCRAASRRGDPDAGAALAGILAVLQGELPSFSHEYPCHAPAQPRWYLMTVVPLEQQGGAVITHLNITGRKQAEIQLRQFTATLEATVRQRTAALLESETTTRALLESPVDAVYLLDRRGRLLELNNTMAEMLGCPREALLGQNVFAFLPEEVALSRRRKLAWVFRHRRPLRFEDQINSRWVDQVYTPILSLSGPVAKVAVSARDVTERKEAELAQARLAAIVESTGDAVTVIAVDGTITEWNRAAEQLYGYSAQQALGQNMRMLLPPDRSHELSSNLHKLRRGVAVITCETERLHRSGRRLPVALTISPVRDSSGGLVRISAMARDIRERKRLENEVLRVSEMERQRLGRDLHDGLSQQLTAAMLISGALEQSLAQQHRPEARQAATIARYVGEATAAARDLARGLYSSSLQTSGLGTALEELAAHVAERFALRCQFHGPRDLRLVDENLSRQLYRIAQEALDNAAKHSRCRSIQLLLRRHRRGLSLSIRDDGSGRVAPRSSAAMGLSLMRYRADLVGARLLIRQRPGHGTTVTCTVPCS